MIVLKSFIWKESHKAYHITLKSNLKSIKEKGLIAQNGVNCKRVKDTNFGVFFTDYDAYALEWIDMIYETDHLEDFIVVEFDLLGRKWEMGGGDFYCTESILPEDIKIYDASTFLETVRK